MSKVAIAGVLALASVTGACRIDFAGIADARDVLTDGADGVDAIDVSTPFSDVVELGYLNDGGYQDDDPSLTDDLLELYFDSNRPGGMGMGDCWVARRSSTAEPFGTPQLVAELASPADDTTFDVAPDGLTMYFASDRVVAGDRDLYVTTRPDRASAWSAPVRIAELASTADDSAASELDDHLHLVFASARAGTFDLYMATRTATDQPWSTIALIPGLSDPMFEESQQWTSGDGRLVYFVSDRSGTQEDLWVATRATPTAAFDPPHRLDELASAFIDADPWLSADRRTIFFSRVTVADGWHLYMATR